MRMSEIIEDKEMLETLTKEEIWKMFIRATDGLNKANNKIRILEKRTESLESENNKLEIWLHDERKKR
jgi:hypothetical protein